MSVNEEVSLYFLISWPRGQKGEKRSCGSVCSMIQMEPEWMEHGNVLRIMEGNIRQERAREAGSRVLA